MYLKVYKGECTKLQVKVNVLQPSKNYCIPTGKTQIAQILLFYKTWMIVMDILNAVCKIIYIQICCCVALQPSLFSSPGQEADLVTTPTHSFGI